MQTHQLHRSVKPVERAGRAFHSLGAFTLLEILIAMALVAILIAASIPYLYDAAGSSEADRMSDSIAARVQEVRKQSMESGLSKDLEITSNKIVGLSLPIGWSLQLKGINDSRFRPPLRGEKWTFTPAGICQPLELRIGNGERSIALSFDALTGELLHDRP